MMFWEGVNEIGPLGSCIFVDDHPNQIYSIDVQPTNTNDILRLATAGTNCEISMWQVYLGNIDRNTQYEFITDLRGHKSAVNIVRFSPNGGALASGGDDGVIIIWIQDDYLPTRNEDKERWVRNKILNCHMAEVYDLSWSPDNTSIISGHKNNAAVVWNVEKGRVIGKLDHKGAVQGVAWDPKNKLLATLSTDRCFRVYDSKSKKQVAEVVKRINSNGEAQEEDEELNYLFHDNTLNTSFRRISFSSDGLLIFTPCGVETTILGGQLEFRDKTHIFSRFSFNNERSTNQPRPEVELVSTNQYSVAVKCSPVLYRHRPKTHNEFCPLPYRMLFAVACTNTVELYDTQGCVRIGSKSFNDTSIISDLSWSSDGRLLVASSRGGSFLLITFQVDEIASRHNRLDLSEYEPFLFRGRNKRYRSKYCHTSVYRSIGNLISLSSSEESEAEICEITSTTNEQEEEEVVVVAIAGPSNEQRGRNMTPRYLRRNTARRGRRN